MKTLKYCLASIPLTLQVLLALTLVGFIIPFKATCQISKIDSLQTVVKDAKNDTSKVTNLNTLAWLLMDRDYAKALDYALESAEIASNLKWEKGLAYAYRN